MWTRDKSSGQKLKGEKKYKRIYMDRIAKMKHDVSLNIKYNSQ